MEPAGAAEEALRVVVARGGVEMVEEDQERGEKGGVELVEEDQEGAEKGEVEMVEEDQEGAGGMVGMAVVRSWPPRECGLLRFSLPHRSVYIFAKS